MMSKYKQFEALLLSFIIKSQAKLHDDFFPQVRKKGKSLQMENPLLSKNCKYVVAIIKWNSEIEQIF